jgi:hypothetical protein
MIVWEVRRAARRRRSSRAERAAETRIRGGPEPLRSYEMKVPSAEETMPVVVVKVVMVEWEVGTWPGGCE